MDWLILGAQSHSVIGVAYFRRILYNLDIDCGILEMFNDRLSDKRT